MDENLEKRRHSAAHVLAMAVLRLFPEAKLGVGPVTKEGFYHDLQTPQRLKWEDIKRIEAEMNLIIQEDLTFNQFYTSYEEAFQLLLSRGQIYKSELLQQIQDQRISFYKTGEEFVDLCRGPHVSSSNQIGAVKLLSVSDVHWKNDSDRPIMQRIAGVAFATPEQLNKYLSKQEAVQKKDFLKVSEDLGLVILDDNNIYTPEGAIVIKSIADRIAISLEQNHFRKIIHFRNRDQQQITEQLHKVYKMKNRSYRSLPLRLYSQDWMEFKDTKDIQGKKLNNFNLFSAITYATPENLTKALTTDLNTMLDMSSFLDLKVSVNVHAAELNTSLIKDLSNQLKDAGISHTQVIDASVPDDGLTLSVMVTDELEREWEIINMVVKPSQTTHVDMEGEFKNNMQIETRIIVESIWGYYLEELDGELPYWTSPVQIITIPISEAQTRYANKVNNYFNSLGYRAILDDRSETMQSRIRDAELDKTPVLVIIGEKEENAESVSLRFRNKQEMGMVSLAEVTDNLLEYLQEYT